MERKRLSNNDEKTRYLNQLQEFDDTGSNSEQLSEDDSKIDPHFSYTSGETSEDACNEDNYDDCMVNEND